MDGSEIEKALEDLETRIERLRALYEQYFMGIEKLEPQIPRKEVERRITIFRKEQIRNTAQRFKFQTLIQRYNTMQQYWGRVVREIENGTFRRDVLKAAARFGEKDIQKLLGNAGIVRSRAKIEATIHAAKIYCDMKKRGEDFSDYCWGFTGGKVTTSDGKSFPATSPLSEAISKDMKKRGFKFVGPTIVYAWMQAVGMVNDHSHQCFRRKNSKRG